MTTSEEQDQSPQGNWRGLKGLPNRQKGPTVPHYKMSFSVKLHNPQQKKRAMVCNPVGFKGTLT
jgi:hypothetical protein